jgi:four helix bundle protein
MARNYRDLEIYLLSHKLAVEVHKASLKLPRFEIYEEGSQLRRAAKSIPTNIVEGFGRRRYKNEFLKFLVYALASCDETREHLEILFETGSFADKESFEHFLDKYDELGRKINNFIKAVNSGHMT